MIRRTNGLHELCFLMMLGLGKVRMNCYIIMFVELEMLAGLQARGETPFELGFST